MFPRTILVLTLTFALGGTALAAASFKASYDGTFSVVGPLLEFHGTGLATVLGTSTVDGSSILVPIGPTESCPLPKVAFSIENDRVKLTGANGDTIDFVNSGTDCFDPATGIIIADATYVIVGGTGRFAEATGSGTVTVVAQCASATDCTTGTFKELNFSGTLARR